MFQILPLICCNQRQYPALVISGAYPWFWGDQIWPVLRPPPCNSSRVGARCSFQYRTEQTALTYNQTVRHNKIYQSLVTRDFRQEWGHRSGQTESYTISVLDKTYQKYTWRDFKQWPITKMFLLKARLKVQLSTIGCSWLLLPLVGWKLTVSAPLRASFQVQEGGFLSILQERNVEMSDGWQDFSSQQTCEAKQIVYQFSDQGAATGLAGRENWIVK